jgi:hypothetical protein
MPVFILFLIDKHMSKRAQVKPLSAYKELTESRRRLVNKLIIGLHAETIDEDTRLNINRAINRTRRDPNDTGKRYTNGYLDLPSSRRRRKINQLHK